MVTPQGVVKLMDFGIARPNNEAALTVTGTALGSLNYMSPEQVKGVPVDPRSDLYSLGVSLYEMVTGQLPFRGSSNYSLMSAHLEQVPPAPIVVRPGLPQALNDIILMALAKDPAGRFQSAEAFRNALATVDPGSMPAAPRYVATPASATRAATPTAPPSYQPTVPAAAMAAAATAPAPTKGHRGLYMALGALIVVAVLFAAGFYLPRHMKTQASPDSSNSSTTEAQPATAPAQTPEQIAAIVAAQRAADAAAAQKEQDAAASAAQQQAADAQSQKERAAGLAQAEAERQAAIKRDAELAEDEKQSDQLDARAAAVTASLDNLRRGQAQQGVGLRGDMAAAEQLMHTNLSRAQSAIEAKDPEKAKQYLDAADAQAEKLEHFLGR